MLRRWLALGLGMAGTAIAIAGGLGWTMRPATYRDAVVAELNQLRIAHAEVELRAICVPDPACIITTSTKAFAVIVIHRDRASYGRVTCYDRGGDCYLDLLNLGIRNVALRDVRGVRVLPKRLAQLAEHIAARVRGWGQVKLDGGYEL